jgi:uncharacterized protein YjbI with pentapeptide repeats
VADEEAVKRPKRSVDEWNAWRNAHQDAGANLSSADLSDANLSGAHLSGADLGGAKLSGARLIHADLSDASIGITVRIRRNPHNACNARVCVSSMPGT